MLTEPYVNEKLDLAESLVCSTDSHIFLTGKAGTGKTTFLRNLRTKCYKRMVVVAPTGVAAINAEGVTIHSFFQLPFGPQLPEKAFSGGANQYAIQKLNRNKIKIIRSLDMLVIDEISMVRADVLDAVDGILRRVRRSSRPFGGVQLLMIGDVHQLAPVAKNEEWEVLSPYYDSVYFFSSHALRATNYICIELDHIYRQNDQRFIDLLNKVRNHDIDSESLQRLNSRYICGFEPDDSEGYITLTTHNSQADNINNAKLDALETKPLVFEARVNGIFPESNYPTKKTLELKVGARVMFVKNDPSPEKQYYNGKIGTLTDYDEMSGELTVDCDGESINVGNVEWVNYEYSVNPETNEIEEKGIGSFVQVPLRLAWAVTIHKSQGLTFDKVVIDAGQAFAHGQVYVALSRCTTLDGIVLKTRIQGDTLISDKDVDGFDCEMPQREINQNKLKDLQHEFQYSMMAELFDFDVVESDFYRLSKVIGNNYSLFQGSVEQDVIALRNDVGARLCEVAHKFAKQMRSLHDNSLVGYAENQALQQRLRQADRYFLEELDKCSARFDTLVFDVDNKAVRKQVGEIVKQLKDDFFIKHKTLEACSDRFDIEVYQKAKAFNSVEAENSSDGEASSVDSSRGSLMWKLKSWRAAKADEEDTSEAAIVPLKALAEIAKLKPTTVSALKNIPKLGKKRIGMYGAEIIRIVAEDLGLEVSDDIEKQAAALVTDTYEQTRQLIDGGLSIDEIVEERHLSRSTIEGHIVRFIENGLYDAHNFVDDEAYQTIYDFFCRNRKSSVSVAKQGLDDKYSYGVIRMVHAQMKNDGAFDEIG